MRSCESIEPLLSSYRDGELPDDIRVQIGEHILTCDMCQATLTAYEHLENDLWAWSNALELPSSFEQAVRQQVEMRESAHLAKRIELGSIISAVAMVAGLLALAITPVGHMAWLVVRVFSHGIQSAYTSIGKLSLPSWFSGSVVVIALTCLATVITCVVSLMYLQRRWSAIDHKLGGYS